MTGLLQKHQLLAQDNPLTKKKKRSHTSTRETRSPRSAEFPLSKKSGPDKLPDCNTVTRPPPHAGRSLLLLHGVQGSGNTGTWVGVLGGRPGAWLYKRHQRSRPSFLICLAGAPPRLGQPELRRRGTWHRCQGETGPAIPSHAILDGESCRLAWHASNVPGSSLRGLHVVAPTGRCLSMEHAHTTVLFPGGSW